MSELPESAKSDMRAALDGLRWIRDHPVEFSDLIEKCSDAAEAERRLVRLGMTPGQAELIMLQQLASIFNVEKIISAELPTGSDSE